MSPLLIRILLLLILIFSIWCYWLFFFAHLYTACLHFIPDSLDSFISIPWREWVKIFSRFPWKENNNLSCVVTKECNAMCSGCKYPKNCDMDIEFTVKWNSLLEFSIDIFILSIRTWLLLWKPWYSSKERNKTMVLNTCNKYFLIR